MNNNDNLYDPFEESEFSNVYVNPNSDTLNNNRRTRIQNRKTTKGLVALGVAIAISSLTVGIAIGDFINNSRNLQQTNTPLNTIQNDDDQSTNNSNSDDLYGPPIPESTIDAEGFYNIIKGKMQILYDIRTEASLVELDYNKSTSEAYSVEGIKDFTLYDVKNLINFFEGKKVDSTYLMATLEAVGGYYPWTAPLNYQYDTRNKEAVENNNLEIQKIELPPLDKIINMSNEKDSFSAITAYLYYSNKEIADMFNDGNLEQAKEQERKLKEKIKAFFFENGQINGFKITELKDQRKTFALDYAQKTFMNGSDNKFILNGENYTREQLAQYMAIGLPKSEPGSNIAMDLLEALINNDYQKAEKIWSMRINATDPSKQALSRSIKLFDLELIDGIYQVTNNDNKSQNQR